MIADAIGVTKAAVYHQYNTKDEIILAVAQVVLAGLEAGGERRGSRAIPLAGARGVDRPAMIDLAVERRRMGGRPPARTRSCCASSRSTAASGA